MSLESDPAGNSGKDLIALGLYFSDSKSLTTLPCACPSPWRCVSRFPRSGLLWQRQSRFFEEDFDIFPNVFFCRRVAEQVRGMIGAKHLC